MSRGQSIEAIGRELGLARNTVRTVLRSGETSPAYDRTVQPRPKLGKWVDELERRLAANERKSRRERLDLIRIHEGLQADGITGGYDTVRRYAQVRQRRLGKAEGDTLTCRSASRRVRPISSIGHRKSCCWAARLGESITAG